MVLQTWHYNMCQYNFMLYRYSFFVFKIFSFHKKYKQRNITKRTGYQTVYYKTEKQNTQLLWKRVGIYPMHWKSYLYTGSRQKSPHQTGWLTNRAQKKKKFRKETSRAADVQKNNTVCTISLQKNVTTLWHHK